MSNQVVDKTLQQTAEGIKQCESNTVFEDVSDKVTQCLPSRMHPPQLGDPFPDQTARAVLQKEYLVDQFTMSTSFTGKRYLFPDTLIANIDALARIIEMYQIFYSDIQIDVRTTSTVYHQGLLQLSWFPCSNSTVNEVYRWSAGDPIDMSFSTQQAATMCVPYTSPRPYIEASDIGNQQGQVCAFSLDLITPYRNTEGTTDFSISVYAKMINPRVARPIPVTSTRTRSSRVRPGHQSLAGTQSTSTTTSQAPVGTAPQPFDVESFSKTTANTSISKVAANFMDPILGIADTIGNVLGLVTSVVGGLDKPTSSQAPQMMQMQFGRDFTQTEGLSSDMRMSQYPVSKLATKRIFPGMTSQAKVTDIARVPMLYLVGSLNQGSSPNTNIQWTVHPKATGTAPTGQTDYLMYVSSAYFRYRGSIRYRLKFVCSAFYKTRVRISLQYGTVALDNKGDVWSRVVEINGDTEVKFLVPFLFNRYWDRFDTINTDSPTVVVELLDNISGAPSGQTPQIDLAVWRAAGPDYQLTDLRFAQYPISSEPEHQSSLRAIFAGDEFEGIVCDCKLSSEMGYCTSELSGTVNDAMKRYTPLVNFYAFGESDQKLEILPPQFSGVGYSFPGLWNDGFQQAALYSNFGSPFYYFLGLFWYWRGDVRVRYSNILEATPPFKAQVFKLLPNTVEANGTAYTYFSQAPELGFEIPYSACYPYLPIQGPTPLMQGDYMTHLIQPADGVPTCGFPVEWGDYVTRHVAAGDNFLCGMLAPPPLWVQPILAKTITTTAKQTSKTPSLTEAEINEAIHQLRIAKAKIGGSQKS